MDTNQHDLTIIKIRYCQEQHLHDQQQIDNENTQKETITNVYTLQRSVRIHLTNKKNFQENKDTQESRKEYMYKRQNVHKINSSRSDICHTEHNITTIQQEEFRDINTLEHLPQRGEKAVTIKQSNITKKKERTKQVIPQRNQM